METSKPKGYEPAPIAEPLLTVDGPVTVEAPARRAHFRDAWAALLLVGNVVALSYVAIKYGADLFQTDADDVDLHFANSKLFQAGCGVAVMAGVFSALYVKLLLHKAGDMIMFSFYVKFALLALAIIACLCSPVPQSAAYPAFILFILACWLRCVRHRVAFAAANLATACHALHDHAAIFCAAVAAVAASLGFIALWIVAAAGAITQTMQGDCDADDDGGAPQLSADAADDAADDGSKQCHPNGLVCLWLFISFVWGLQAIRYVVHLATAGTVAGWWFAGPERAASPVAGALTRACTTSLGSASLAALILAILETLKQMAHQAQRQRNNAGCACFAQCVLGCIERIMRYFNKWALTYCGIYGESFWEAGKSTLELFTRAGWTALINDDLIDMALSMASLVVGLVTAVVALLIGVAADMKSEQTVALVVIGLFAGYFCCQITMSVITSGVCTVFVCFAEDAPALQRSRPEVFERLVAGWRAFSEDLLIIVLNPSSASVV